jgi:hypothetical protein
MAPETDDTERRPCPSRHSLWDFPCDLIAGHLGNHIHAANKGRWLDPQMDDGCWGGEHVPALNTECEMRPAVNQ